MGAAGFHESDRKIKREGASGDKIPACHQKKGMEKMKVTLNPRTIVDTIERKKWFLVKPYPAEDQSFYAVANKHGNLFRWNVTLEEWRNLKEWHRLDR